MKNEVYQPTATDTLTGEEDDRAKASGKYFIIVIIKWLA